MPDHVMVLTRVFCTCCICMDADFFNFHSMGDGVQILFIYLYFIEWCSQDLCIYVALWVIGWYGMISWQGCGHWHFVEGGRKIMEIWRMVCVPFSVWTGHLLNIFGKSSEKQFGPHFWMLVRSGTAWDSLSYARLLTLAVILVLKHCIAVLW
jgi:hypothetical protein